MHLELKGAKSVLIIEKTLIVLRSIVAVFMTELNND
jgi:hypothetical protein